MVAWTNAPRLSELIIWQPVAAGDPPAGPVSWYGVARPLAVSGWAGTGSNGELLQEYRKDQDYYRVRWQEVLARNSRVDVSIHGG